MAKSKRSARTNACDISPDVRAGVRDRDDSCCIWCGKYQKHPQICHYISRGAGGLGIPQNLVCGCPDCHREADQGIHSADYKRRMREYLMKMYPDWDESQLRYKSDFKKFLEEKNDKL